ncbi:hypothetical protein GPECTOR_51g681 [Gonium pectorale]|uniref:Rad21/Rec8-like protein N-terminal domain-containing protein n=1 Tax=Gonium pectorale TaxID=33097 RepID=A0A150G752_GONPE|nr:hypothetical protein GPECTOR_51g681 [Gonium pectorale]|eukprot:KXZ45696.1 hypothetical protein GPECTOR_51g681 [Gonium pectorale]
MFYAAQLVSADGPLKVLWVAATLDRQLLRSQVDGTAIPRVVELYLAPDAPGGIFSAGPPGRKGGRDATPAPSESAPLALRLSGQLLLGVCRIYSRKVSYLLQDCERALLTLRNIMPDEALMAFSRNDDGGSGAEPGGAAHSLRARHHDGGAGADGEEHDGARSGRRGRRRASVAAVGAAAGGPVGPDGEPLMLPYDEEEVLLEGRQSHGADASGAAGAGDNDAVSRSMPGGDRSQALAALRLNWSSPFGGGAGGDAAGGGGVGLFGGGGGSGELLGEGPAASLVGFGSAPLTPGADEHTFFDEEVPEHFEFDLDEHELEALRAASQDLDHQRRQQQEQQQQQQPGRQADPFSTPQQQQQQVAALRGEEPGDEAGPGRRRPLHPEPVGRGGGGGLEAVPEGAEHEAQEEAFETPPEKGAAAGAAEGEMEAEAAVPMEVDSGAAAAAAGPGHEHDEEWFDAEEEEGEGPQEDPGGVRSPNTIATAAAAPLGGDDADMYDPDDGGGDDSAAAAAAAASLECNTSGCFDVLGDGEGQGPGSRSGKAAPPDDAGPAAIDHGTEEYDQAGPPTLPVADPPAAGAAAATTAEAAPPEPCMTRSRTAAAPAAGADADSAAAAAAAVAVEQPAQPPATPPSPDGTTSKRRRQQATSTAAASSSSGAPLLRRLSLDAEKDGRLRTTLPYHSLRDLLQDRTPLIDQHRRSAAARRRAAALAAAAAAPGAPAGVSGPVADSSGSPWLAAWSRVAGPSSGRMRATPAAVGAATNGGRAGGGAPALTLPTTLLPLQLDVALGPAALPAAALAAPLQHVFCFIAGRSGGSYRASWEEREGRLSGAAGGSGAAGAVAVATPVAKRATPSNSAASGQRQQQQQPAAAAAAPASSGPSASAGGAVSSGRSRSQVTTTAAGGGEDDGGVSSVAGADTDAAGSQHVDPDLDDLDLEHVAHSLDVVEPGAGLDVPALLSLGPSEPGSQLPGEPAAGESGGEEEDGDEDEDEGERQQREREELEGEEVDDDGEPTSSEQGGPGRRAAAADGFTARTRGVLRQLQALALTARKAQQQQQQQQELHSGAGGGGATAGGGAPASKRRRMDTPASAAAAEGDEAGPLQVTSATELLVQVADMADPASAAKRRASTAATLSAAATVGSTATAAIDPLAGRVSRMAAARTFYDLLVLSNRGYIQLHVATHGSAGSPYSDGGGMSGNLAAATPGPSTAVTGVSGDASGFRTPGTAYGAALAYGGGVEGELLVVARPRLEEDGADGPSAEPAVAAAAAAAAAGERKQAVQAAVASATPSAGVGSRRRRSEAEGRRATVPSR